MYLLILTDIVALTVAIATHWGLIHCLEDEGNCTVTQCNVLSV